MSKQKTKCRPACTKIEQPEEQHYKIFFNYLEDPILIKAHVMKPTQDENVFFEDSKGNIVCVAYGISLAVKCTQEIEDEKDKEITERMDKFKKGFI